MIHNIKKKYISELDDYINLTRTLKVKKRDITVLSKEDVSFSFFTNNDRAKNFILQFQKDSISQIIRIYSTIYTSKGLGKYSFDIIFNEEDYTTEEINEIIIALKSLTWTIEINSVKGYINGQNDLHFNKALTLKPGVNHKDGEPVKYNDILLFEDFDRKINTITQDELIMLQHISQC